MSKASPHTEKTDQQVLQTRTVAGPAFLGWGVVPWGERHTDLSLCHKGGRDAERRREVTRAVLKRAIQRGEIPADTDIDLFIDALGGAVTFRLLQGHAPLTTKFTSALITLLLAGCSTKESR